MNITLWLDEDLEELEKEEKKVVDVAKPGVEEHKCTCGRKVCCGRHKKGKCSCQNNQKERE